MKKICLLANNDVGLYNFRLELIERLLKEGHEVHISLPYGKRVDDFKKMGVFFHEIELERHGTNPFEELKLISKYKKIIKSVYPDIVFGYTIKPNIYGAIAANHFNIPFVANITGLGTAVENPGIMQKVLLCLYKFAFRNVQRVFFQNQENRKFFEERNIAVKVHDLIPGSGVNLERYPLRDYPNEEKIKFAFVSRIMKEKGIDQYLDAAKALSKKYENVEFHVCGFCENEYEGELQKLIEQKIIVYHGMIDNVADFMAQMHAIIHPTYYPEGMSNVLLESCATGRPIITTDKSGCREIVEDGINGYMIPQKNSNALIEAIEKFLSLSCEEKKRMGINARRKVEQEFDRNIVIEKYMKELTR